MIDIFKWLIKFLYNFAPVIEAVFKDFASLVFGLWELVEIFLAIAAILGILELIFDPKGKEKLANLLSNIVRGGLSVAGILATDLAPALDAVRTSVEAAIRSSGASLHTNVLGSYQDFAGQVLEAQRAAFLSIGTSEPSNALDTAAQAFRTAFGFGLASATVTGAFEALLPEKLNTFNAFGPFFAQMASFEEVAQAVTGPLYENAFGKSAEYFYRGKFKPDYPDETDSVLWHARGLLTDVDLDEIFQVSGLKQKYEKAFITSAYRGISPFVMVRLLEVGVFPEAVAREELTFAGLRPRSQDHLISGAAYLVADPYRKQVQAAAEAQYAAGLLDDADFKAIVDGTRQTNDIDALMLRRAQLQRHTKLSGELEVAYLDLALSGLIDEPAYQSLLAGLPMTQDAINARMAVLDARLKATARKQLLAAERALERQTIAIERRTAMQNYKSGVFDEAALTAALLATGLTPIQIAAWVDLAILQKKGTVRFVYGLERTPADAQLLRERVAALMDQRKKLLIDDQQFLGQLDQLGIPGSYQNALLAAAAALTTPASARTTVQVSTG